MNSMLQFLIKLPLIGRLVEFILMLYAREVGWPTIVRKTGEFKREQQPLLRKLGLLLLFNPVLEYLDTTKVVRYTLHRHTYKQYGVEEAPKSRKKIQSFVEFYHINMADFEPSDIHGYDNFQHFFTRKHRPGSRPIAAPEDGSIAVVSTDCRIVVYDSVPEARRLWIKGHGFTIRNLLQDEKQAAIWNDGAIACFRLSPQDYHRYHSPVSGKVKSFSHFGGEYYAVDPLAVRSTVDVLAVNDRACIHIESPEFGNVMFVAIGAGDVGKIKINSSFKAEGSSVKKGDEIGLFEFGASSLIVLFEAGRIQWDKDLLEWSQERIMVDVEIGNRMGRASRGKKE